MTTAVARSGWCCSAPPGAGKGTQGAIIANHFGVAHIATGDLLRSHIAHETSLGLAMRDILARGDLVPDSIVLEMLRDALADAKRKNGGYVIDGIPRTMEQAHAGVRHRHPTRHGRGRRFMP